MVARLLVQKTKTEMAHNREWIPSQTGSLTIMAMCRIAPSINCIALSTKSGTQGTQKNNPYRKRTVRLSQK